VIDKSPVLDEKALEMAADKLEKNGRFYNWWSDTVPGWRKADPIGKEEFLTVVHEIVTAYLLAATQTTAAQTVNSPIPVQPISDRSSS
jgi:hypothetical protein